MRGKLKQTNGRLSMTRITPADAGKTMYITRTALGFLGSPPRMRGKLFGKTSERERRRITPADAGKTTQATTSSPNAPDHPRGCGENYSVNAGHQCRLGSPPRMRGKPALPQARLFLAGITPADAGKTLLGILLGVRARDHPRGCGENPLCCLDPAVFTGSPPRMRGKLGSAGLEGVVLRITPADAGKTARSCARACGSQDHPRGCGENDLFATAAYRMRGSPPRMRGKQNKHFKRARDSRITPADAGKTPSETARKSGLEDHPRGCGENAKGQTADNRLSGSPPRMRGKLPACNRPSRADGITPADAGKTCRLCF